MLLEQPFFWIQITKIKSSAGSILTLSANVFICSSDLPGLQQSYQTHEKILGSLQSWSVLRKHKPRGCFGGRAETWGLAKDQKKPFRTSKLPLKNAAHLCRKTGCQPLTDPVIQVLQPAGKSSQN